MRPKLCFFENVEGHISLGLSDVIEDLAGMGYRTTWGIFSAAECGAPHQRKRVFILAVAGGIGGTTRFSRQITGHEGQSGISDNSSYQGCGELADARGICSERANQNRVNRNWIFELSRESKIWSEAIGCGKLWPSRPGQPQHAWEPPRVVGNTSDTGQPQRGSGTMGQPEQKPQPKRSDSNRDNTEREIEPTLGGDADGSSDRLDDAKLYVTCDSRIDELRLLGNGVVPACSALAFTTLLNEQRNTRHLA
jgi:DNA (cytosine-5)-methyltransferase 1